jgi:hypothetical protein
MNITANNPDVLAAGGLTENDSNAIYNDMVKGWKATAGVDKVVYISHHQGVVGAKLLTLVAPLTGTPNDADVLARTVDAFDTADLKPLAPNGNQVKGKNLVAVIGDGLEKHMKDKTISGKKVYFLWAPGKKAVAMTLRGEVGSVGEDFF